MKRPRRSRIARAVTSGLLALGIALAACRRPEDRLWEERILLARISLDGRWSPCARAQTVAAPGYCRTLEEVVGSAGTRHLRGGAGEKHRSPLRTLLLDRRSARLDQAISQLESDARRAPGEADRFVDL